MILRAFWDFWAKPIRAEPLALFRILLALTILASLLTGIGRVLPEACGPDGYCPIKANDEWLADGFDFCSQFFAFEACLLFCMVRRLRLWHEVACANGRKTECLKGSLSDPAKNARAGASTS